MVAEVHRGEVWMVEFAPPDKRRPVLVLTRDESIRLLNTVLVAPITTTLRGGPSQVLVGAEVGLKGPSAVNLHNLQSVPRAGLRRHVGRVSPAVMDAVCRALSWVTGCGVYASGPRTG